MNRLYQTVCACQGKSTAADLYTATETCGSSVMTHTSRLQLFASLVDERAHFGQGVYATQHEPADARLNVMYLANLEQFDGIGRSKNKNPVLGNISKKDRFLHKKMGSFLRTHLFAQLDDVHKYLRKGKRVQSPIQWRHLTRKPINSIGVRFLYSLAWDEAPELHRATHPKIFSWFLNLGEQHVFF